ncbi:aspyridones efflux protein apdF-like [Teratosphaeria destructans]|uniref:Aspyridones efflux protein apdF-like n=1 Tax=Teratosphaeria destructans TaxID=418781 RepID=A0A9W7W158_9PEZI|nr:aspyridones efflux protein apdF-like [Teratosphaeria destructans]
MIPHLPSDASCGEKGDRPDQNMSGAKETSCASISQASCSDEDINDLERAPTQRSTGHTTGDKSAHAAHTSLDLRRTASRAQTILERVFTTRSVVDPPPPPDGGLQAWLQVVCGWLVLFTTWGWVNSYGTFQTYYTDTLAQPASTISWIGTIQTWLTFIVGIFSGRALDAGFLRPVVVAGAVIQVLGIFMMSLSTTYWQLMLTQGVMTGLGGGLFFTPSLGLIATYFDGRRAFATGLATTGNAIGGAIYPLIVKELLPKLGFAWTARALGFLNLGLLAIVIALMKPRLPPRTSGPMLDLASFKDIPYTLYVACLFFSMGPIYFTFYYLASFGEQSLHLSYSTSTILIILLNATGTPARILPAFFADKLGQLNLLVPTLLALNIAAWSWLAVSSIPGLYAFTVVYGLLNGTYQSLMPSTVAKLTPRLDMVGTRLGMAFGVLSFARSRGHRLEARSRARWVGGMGA